MLLLYAVYCVMATYTCLCTWANGLVSILPDHWLVYAWLNFLQYMWSQVSGFLISRWYLKCRFFYAPTQLTCRITSHYLSVSHYCIACSDGPYRFACRLLITKMLIQCHTNVFLLVFALPGTSKFGRPGFIRSRLLCVYMFSLVIWILIAWIRIIHWMFI